MKVKYEIVQKRRDDIMLLIQKLGTVSVEQLSKEFSTSDVTIRRDLEYWESKGAIQRSEPGFLCHALIPKSAVQEAETDELINKVYDGSADKLFAALLGSNKISAEQIRKLKQIVDELE